MGDAQSVPELGAIRFADDGKLEVFDGTAWSSYRPPLDDGGWVIFKGVGPLPVVQSRLSADEQR
jgi:hypothetical protein